MHFTNYSIPLRDEVVIENIPKINPARPAYEKFWGEEIVKCIDGIWVHSKNGWKWCSPQLYFYLNFWTIKVKLKVTDKNKVTGRPFYRKLEWDKSIVFTCARGFSGFEKDDEYSCHTILAEEYPTGYHPRNKEEIEAALEIISQEERELIEPRIRKKNGAFKTFMYSVEYLQRDFKKNLGTAYYDNDAFNVVDIEARECFGKDTLVRMIDGSTKKVEDITTGDKLLGPDGEERNVQWVHSGVDTLYKINRKRGKPIIVNSNHQLEIVERVFQNGKYLKGKRLPGKWSEIKHAVPVQTLFEKQKTSSFTNCHYIYQADSIPYNVKDLDIDPYYLGLWLADGRSNCTCVVNTDAQLWNYQEQFAKDKGFKCDVKIRSLVENQKLVKEHYIKDVNFRRHFQNYNLLNNKHIPGDYLYSSIEQRLQLLAGLIDGDGWLDNFEAYRVSAGNSLDYAKQIQELAQSLGFHSSIITTDNSKKKKHWKLFYCVSISGNTNVIPVIQNRKKIKTNNHRVDITRSSFSIEKLEQGEFYGFHLDKDHLFCLDDYTVQHNTGKSYWASALICQNFIFDGALNYAQYCKNRDEGNDEVSETLVAAIKSNYADDLLSKFEVGFDNLPGKQKNHLGEIIPSPFYRETSGSIKNGNTLTAGFETKMKGGWDETHGSKIHNRTFADGPFAASGARNNLIFLEEVGFFHNLIETLAVLKNTMTEGTKKMGTCYMMGTGGDMEGGSTEAVKEVFYKPNEYRCLVFSDCWEDNQSSTGIGYFVPAYAADNAYLDKKTGIIDTVKSKIITDRERERLKKAGNSKNYNSELENKPYRPSEAFLTTGTNKFPVAELMAHLNSLISNPRDTQKNIGTLFVNAEGHIEFKPAFGEMDICDYPVNRKGGNKKNTNLKGAVQIWEFPDPKADYGWYVGGTDPFAEDQAPNSESLGSIFIMRRSMVSEGVYNEYIVAEYTGRPDTVDEFNEMVRRLLVFYGGAINLYENNFNSLKGYFQRKYCLHLLAKKPSLIESSDNQASTYGIRMSNQYVKSDVMKYLAQWLKTSIGHRDDGTELLNLHNIYSIALLKELIAYNDKGNFDRVISLSLAVLQCMQMHEVVPTDAKNEEPDDFFSQPIGVNRSHRQETYEGNYSNSSLANGLWEF